MITCLCYGDSNTWGAIPGPVNSTTGFPKRHPKEERWTGILQKLLGFDYEVIEEGLNSRTTNLDDLSSNKPHINGLSYLPFCLEVHYPIDCIVFMLGLNDTKSKFHRSAVEIANGMRELISVAKRLLGKNTYVVLVAPPPLSKTSELFPQFDQKSIETSKLIAKEYKKLAEEEDVVFLNAADTISTSAIDGLHFDSNQCALLGQQIAKKIQEKFKK